MNKKAFTLVELIVVITILAILGTISFMYFQMYIKDTRDAVRITDMRNIGKSIEMFGLEKGNYPEPDNGVQIVYSGAEVWTQGTFGKQGFIAIEKLSKLAIDPIFGVEFTYSITNSKNEYELGAVQEGGSLFSQKEINIINKSYAGDIQNTSTIIMKL